MFSDSFQESNSSHPYFLLDYDCIHLERKSLFQTVHVFTEALAIVFEECFTLQIQGRHLLPGRKPGLVRMSLRAVPFG